MHAHERRFDRLQIALDEGNVHRAIDVVIKAIHRELAILGFDPLLGDTLDVAFFFEPVANQVGNGADANPALFRKALEIRAPRHRAVLVEDLDDCGRWLEAGKTRQVATGFGMAGARQYAAGLRHDRKDVTRLAQVLGSGVGRDGRLDRLGAIVCRDARRDAFGGLDRDREVGRVMLIRIADHQRQAQLLAALACHRQAYQAAAVCRHVVDVLGPDLRRSHDEVTLVLAILVIDHDDHLAVRDIGDDVFDIAERRRVRVWGRFFRHNRGP